MTLVEALATVDKEPRALPEELLKTLQEDINQIAVLSNDPVGNKDRLAKCIESIFKELRTYVEPKYNRKLLHAMRILLEQHKILEDGAAYYSIKTLAPYIATFLTRTDANNRNGCRGTFLKRLNMGGGK